MIRIIDNAGSLSEDDLKLLVGTDTIIQMIKNRVIVVIDKKAESLDWIALTKDITGLYHIREMSQQRLYQVWFENVHDIEQFKKNLYIAKLSLDKQPV